MKTSLITAALAIAGLLTGCQGLTLTAVTPYGDVSTTNGLTTIAVRPVIVGK